MKLFDRIKYLSKRGDYRKYIRACVDCYLSTIKEDSGAKHYMRLYYVYCVLGVKLTNEKPKDGIYKFGLQLSALYSCLPHLDAITALAIHMILFSEPEGFSTCWELKETFLDSQGERYLRDFQNRRFGFIHDRFSQVNGCGIILPITLIKELFVDAMLLPLKLLEISEGKVATQTNAVRSE